MDNTLATVSDNLAAVRERIAKAAGAVGRSGDEIVLIAVTKTIDVPRIREAVAAGVHDLGENYVQEAVKKIREFQDDVRWHFIGHLQRNKARHAPGVFSVVQSVDSLALAQEIGKRAARKECVTDVLLEVKASEEATKFGVPPERAIDLAAEISEVPGVNLQGLMGMAPFVSDPDDARPYFELLKTLWDKLPREQRRWLSMGMSHDFEAAIREGSNMVRVGTAIFGPRG